MTAERRPVVMRASPKDVLFSSNVVFPSMRRSMKTWTNVSRAHAPERAVAETHGHQREWGRYAQRGQLSPCAISPDQALPCANQGHSRGRQVHADRSQFMVPDGIEYRDLGRKYFAANVARTSSSNTLFSASVISASPWGQNPRRRHELSF